MGILDNFKNPWSPNYKSNAALGNALGNNTNDSDPYNVLNTLALQTDVLLGNDEVLGQIKEFQNLEENANFNGELLLMEYNSVEYENYWKSKGDKEKQKITGNPFKSGEDFSYSITREDEFNLGESSNFKAMIASQILKWKNEIKQQGQNINDVVLSDSFLFDKMYSSIGVLAGLVDSLSNPSIFSILSDANENIRANSAIVSRFRQNSSEDFVPAEPIQDFFREDVRTGKLIESLENRFKHLLIKYSFQPNKINIFSDWRKNDDYKNIPDFKFNPFKSGNNTKAIENLVVGGVQGLRLYLKNLKVKRFGPDLARGIRDVNFNYSAEFELQFIDDFGLNSTDIGSTQTSDILKEMGTPFLIAFWILQHQRGYRPFANIIKIPFKTHGIIKDTLL